MTETTTEPTTERRVIQVPLPHIPQQQYLPIIAGGVIIIGAIVIIAWLALNHPTRVAAPQQLLPSAVLVATINVRIPPGTPIPTAPIVTATMSANPHIVPIAVTTPIDTPTFISFEVTYTPIPPPPPTATPFCVTIDDVTECSFASFDDAKAKADEEYRIKHGLTVGTIIDKSPTPMPYKP